MQVPFLAPNPPRLSQMVEELRAIEASGVFTNFGPLNSRFEGDVVDRIFGGQGSCLAVCNATIGLMLAIRDAVASSSRQSGRYALMPSFTFAATPHAALWCGLTPVLYDVEPDTWLPSAVEESRLVGKYGDDIAVIIPYATFGNCLDMSRYEQLSQLYSIPIVVDAATSLGSKDSEDRGFGQGSASAIVFSMHATKTFATSEGGLIYSADADRIHRLRNMANFGFSEPRNAHHLGLNAKLSEVSALMALAKLDEITKIVSHRQSLYEAYLSQLPDFSFQRLTSSFTAHQFVAALLPKNARRSRDEFASFMRNAGIGVASYFSPHIAEQPFFRETCVLEALPVTDELSRRVVSLPLFDQMSVDQVRLVCSYARKWIETR